MCIINSTTPPSIYNYKEGDSSSWWNIKLILSFTWNQVWKHYIDVARVIYGNNGKYYWQSTKTLAKHREMVNSDAWRGQSRIVFLTFKNTYKPDGQWRYLLCVYLSPLPSPFGRHVYNYLNLLNIASYGAAQLTEYKRNGITGIHYIKSNLSFIWPAVGWSKVSLTINITIIIGKW